MLVELSQQHSAVMLLYDRFCCVLTRSYHTLFILSRAILSLHQEEQYESMNITTTTTTATPTTATAATATAAADTTKKRARECDVAAEAEKRVKLQPIKLRRLSLTDIAVDGGQLKLHDLVALTKDGVCSKWAVVQMLPDTKQCLLMVSATACSTAFVITVLHVTETCYFQ